QHLAYRIQCQPSEDEIVSAVGDADAIITATVLMPFSRKVLKSLRNCKFIMSVGIGYDKLDVEAATELGIIAANIPDASLEEVSDHAMALILACTRRVIQLNDSVRLGNWETTNPYIRKAIWPRMSRLRGQILGLIGFGRIARTLVPKATGFGLKIIAYDDYVPESIFRNFGVACVTLDQLLTQADIVSLHVPLTSETTYLLGLEQLKKMKPSGCLINTARGAVVDSEALYIALSNGYISVAALDVTDPEPIALDSPLLTLSNIIVTAHSAHVSPLSAAEQYLRPAEELIRVVRGEWPIGLLNPEVKEKYLQKWS
ncbi:C-terminal binding protein, partial [Chloroflexota bacterium]